MIYKKGEPIAELKLVKLRKVINPFEVPPNPVFNVTLFEDPTLPLDPKWLVS